MLAIVQRELKAYFVSPIAYIVMAVFLLISGYFFTLILHYSRDADMMRYLFGNMAVILLLVSPLISMRLIAEERKTGTIELLLTSPITDWGIVFGKFLASCLLLLIMLLISFYFPVILIKLGKPDIYPILTGYLGLFLMGSSFLSIGVLTSGWTNNQIVAAFVSFGISLLVWFLGAASGIVGSELGGVLNYLSLNSHFDTFTKGILDTSDIVYYLSVIIISLFLTVQSLETRKWR